MLKSRCLNKFPLINFNSVSTVVDAKPLVRKDITLHRWIECFQSNANVCYELYLLFILFWLYLAITETKVRNNVYIYSHAVTTVFYT